MGEQLGEFGGFLWVVISMVYLSLVFRITYAEAPPESDNGDYGADLEIEGVVRGQTPDIVAYWEVWKDECSDSA